MRANSVKKLQTVSDLTKVVTFLGKLSKNIEKFVVKYQIFVVVS